MGGASINSIVVYIIIKIIRNSMLILVKYYPYLVMFNVNLPMNPLKLLVITINSPYPVFIGVVDYSYKITL